MLKNKAVCFGICHHFALQLFFPLSFDHVLFSPCLPPSHFSSVWSSVLQGVLAGWFWELMGAAQSLSPFPNRLDTDIGRTPVSAVVFWVSLLSFNWGLLAILKTGYVLLLSGTFGARRLVFSHRHWHHAGLVAIGYLSPSAGILAFVETSCYLVL